MQPMQINPDIVVFVRVGTLYMDISCLLPGIVLAHEYYTQNCDGNQKVALSGAVPSKSSGNHRRALESALDGG